MIDIATLQRWIEEIGYCAEAGNGSTLRIRLKEASVVDLPPFFVQCTDHWVVLSMFEVLGGGGAPAAGAGEGGHAVAGSSALMLDFLRRLLEVNREMRVAKFALDERDEIVLCAELPTESLDLSEFTDAVERMMEYATTYRRLLLGASA